MQLQIISLDIDFDSLCKNCKHIPVTKYNASVDIEHKLMLLMNK